MKREAKHEIHFTRYASRLKSSILRIPLKIHFGGRANLFVAGLCQTKATLSIDKADLSSLPAS
ncbi:MAG: hypothetical protein KKI18_01575, partial [Planctomycetes bacterium]|nr:hypothetical protein [Planctomycetota bacterium]